jgi:hypothetical protein
MKYFFSRVLKRLLDFSSAVFWENVQTVHYTAESYKRLN